MLLYILDIKIIFLKHQKLQQDEDCLHEHNYKRLDHIHNMLFHLHEVEQIFQFDLLNYYII